jgi:hypothetical protein
MTLIQNKRKNNRSHLIDGLRIGSYFLGAAGTLLAVQAMYVIFATPKLSPPENSGYDFVKDGILVEYSYNSEDLDEKDEFHLVMIGDSPVEGIGHDCHSKTLGGCAALAFSEHLKQSVRFWSFGKSGLTAEGIEREMVPLIKGMYTKKKKGIDAIVVSVGVNNVLIGQSANKFRQEVQALLQSIEKYSCGAKIIVIQLLDFAQMPFLPYPLRGVFSWKSKILQMELETVISELRLNGLNICMSFLPNVHELLGGNREHWLWEYLRLSKDERQQIHLSDFFAVDNFHPGGYGCAIISKILVDAFILEQI